MLLINKFYHQVNLITRILLLFALPLFASKNLYSQETQSNEGSKSMLIDAAFYSDVQQAFIKMF